MIYQEESGREYHIKRGNKYSDSCIKQQGNEKGTGSINQYRTRLTGSCDIECILDNSCQIFSLSDSGGREGQCNIDRYRRTISSDCIGGTGALWRRYIYKGWNLWRDAVRYHGRGYRGGNRCCPDGGYIKGICSD